MNCYIENFSFCTKKTCYTQKFCLIKLLYSIQIICILLFKEFFYRQTVIQRIFLRKNCFSKTFSVKIVMIQVILHCNFIQGNCYTFVTKMLFINCYTQFFLFILQKKKNILFRKNVIHYTDFLHYYIQLFSIFKLLYKVFFK